MQTFLPYPNFADSLDCLDYRRLGKQRVEAYQIVNALEGKCKGLVNHPATKMWADNIDALNLYCNTAINKWIMRGYKNTMKTYDVSAYVDMPSWLGDLDLHASHKSNLLRKDPEFYGQYGWNEPHDLDYVWPTPESAFNTHWLQKVMNQYNVA